MNFKWIYFLILTELSANSFMINPFQMKNKGIIESIKKTDKNYNTSTDNDLITLSPAGLKGFYTLGVSVYIKENYDLDNYFFSGASAGAWNALYLSYKNDPWDFPKLLSDVNFDNITSVYKMEIKLKELLLSSFKTEDFHLDRLFIGVTSFEKFKFINKIYTNFESLEDAIECCIASSHIPFLTGGLIRKYRKKISFDGGFSSYPYYFLDKPVIHINPDMWKIINGYLDIKNEINIINAYRGLLLKEHKNFEDFFIAGYNETRNNKEIIDKLML